ncbi:MAG: phosphatase PAP2/dual specificity phosphatase family protein [Xanthomonadaceae bacterium]|jgi:protein-tyrosine phosphatase|nr:phosphatase PAP2/dual specificity phosphatase family protein [Xanthomonadaceae bacterium]
MNIPSHTIEDARWLRKAFGRGALWLLFLGPFFFLTYGLANQHAARMDAVHGVGSLVFDWEHHIPLWPWTIIPYWSIDLLYGFAFLCCRDKAATNRLAFRLLSAQLICVICFFLWPLRFTFERPAIEGVSGALFEALTSFDLPYNQAPSLHVALLVIIWRQFATFATVRAAQWGIHIWALLIGLSVLTTWQHHFIDVPTGLAAGLLCLWLWPEQGKTPLKKAEVRRPALALPYFLGAALFFSAAIALGGIGLLLCWPALSLALVAFNYAWAGAAGFQKQEGQYSLAAKWLFAPYTLGAWINSRLWTRRYPDPSPMGDGIWLGRLPTARELAAWAKQRNGKTALFDLTAELPAPDLPAGTAYDGMPCLDLVPVPASSRQGGDLLEAMQRLTALKRGHPDCEIWVACALGVSRSASVVVAWQCSSMEKAANVQDTVEQVRLSRPHIVIGQNSVACLEEFCKRLFRDDNPVAG